MAGKLIKIENEYYLTTDTKVEEGDYGVIFAHGINGFGRGWHTFHHEGTPGHKLNAICAGTRKITHSTAPIDGDEVGSSFHIIEQLSLKNCQAIENGYDLDEMAKKHYDVHIKQGHTEEDSLQRKIDFILGFVSALEILGDKKFSERDVILIAEYVRVASQSTPDTRTKDLFDEYQSPQQTEWDVEIVTEPYVKYVSRGNYSVYPPLGIQNKLDTEGNLILKRK